jgi:DNA-binding transcriptional ArsR family regulator
MSALPKKRIDRNEVFNEVSKLIKQSPDKEIEISSSELADSFGVQAPSMDYHLKILVEEGKLSLSPKRGRYNRKIYRLPAPANLQENHTTQTVTPEDSDQFKQFLDDYLTKSKHSQEELDFQEEKVEEKPTEIEEETNENQEKVIDQIPETETLPQIEEKPLQIKELSLDERIEEFLNNANQVHDANVLLKHEDKEILSVMNETIHQTSIYLKDLSDQLSTIQNKELIQHLVDDRARMQSQIEKLEKEVDEARQQASQTKEQYEIDPNRVRFMQQMMIDTVDNYVNQANHSIALNRSSFRNKLSKELTDLVKYVLHLEK